MLFLLPRSLGRAALLTVLLAGTALAQTPLPERRLPTDRPVVGLVLSGGSAKGIAHIGALRVLEEAGLPVDVVTGTSMGSIVGGLYALGYQPDSLAALVQGQDWTALFVDETARGATLLEGRLVSSPTLVSVPISGGSVALPSGLVAGQRIFEFLAGLTWPAHGETDFRRLPRPFGAVVTDLRTGRAVLLDHGFLPLAIRASMSLPSLFAPVEIDGRVYVDGGLVRNLPAEDARTLGADVLVCVDVSDPPLPEDEAFSAGSLLDVLLRTALFQAEANAEEQRALCDLVIDPDIDGLSSFAFDEAGAWIERGEAAAQAKRGEIDALVARLGNPGLGSPPPPEVAAVEIGAVEVRGTEGWQTQRIRRRLGLTLPARLGPQQITRAVERVYGMGAFDLVTYRHVPDSTGTNGAAGTQTLIVDVEPGQEDRLGFGFRYDEQYKAALLFTLSLQNRLLFGSQTRFAVRLGQQTQLEASAFARLGVTTPFRAGARAGYTSVPLNIFTPLASRAIASARVDVYGVQLFAGPAISEAALLSFALIGEHARFKPIVAPEGAETTTETFYSGAVFFFADTQDRTFFPSRGLSVLAKLEVADAAFGSGASFQHFVADARLALPVTRSVSLLGRVARTRGTGDGLPAHYFTFLGGANPPALLPGRFYPLYGAEDQELIGPSARLAALGVQWEFGDELFARLVGNVGMVGEFSLESLDLGFVRAGVGLTLGALTLVGPATLTLSGDDFGSFPRISVSLGYPF